MLKIYLLGLVFAKKSFSRIISTWIPFLGVELQLLIYWPTVEETLSYTLQEGLRITKKKQRKLSLNLALRKLRTWTIL